MSSDSTMKEKEQHHSTKASHSTPPDISQPKDAMASPVIGGTLVLRMRSYSTPPHQEAMQQLESLGAATAKGQSLFGGVQSHGQSFEQFPTFEEAYDRKTMLGSRGSHTRDEFDQKIWTQPASQESSKQQLEVRIPKLRPEPPKEETSVEFESKENGPWSLRSWMKRSTWW